MGYSRMAALKGKYSRGTAAANEAITKMLLEKNHMERDWESDKVFMGQMYDRQDAHNEKMMKLDGPVDFRAIQNERNMVNAGIGQVVDGFIQGQRDRADMQMWLDHTRRSQQTRNDFNTNLFESLEDKINNRPAFVPPSLRNAWELPPGTWPETIFRGPNTI